MAIPDFQTLMFPVLRASQNGEVQIGEVVSQIADEFQLSEEDRAELLPSGRQSTFTNRVHWAKSYLVKAGLLAITKRGHFCITDRGADILKLNPKHLDIKYLMQFPEFQVFRGESQTVEEGKPPVKGLGSLPSNMTPDEILRGAQSQIETDLATELLQRILLNPPAFFERVIVQLLLAMGYGGSIQDAGKALGKSGDGGIDGVINEDALGLDRIYVQAKRYAPENSVGSGAIRDFFGALDQFKAGKGLFVTTSTFTDSAKKTAEGLSKRIVLIDGSQLTRLMVKHGVGCRIEETILLKKIDEDFFDI